MARAKYTPEALQKAVDEYFDKCRDEKVTAVYGKTQVQVSRPPTMEGLALHLGIGRATLYKYADGTVQGDTDGETLGEAMEARDTLRDIASRARDRIILDAYEGASLGRYNDRVTNLRLGRMGETVAERHEISGSMAVKWEGMSAEDTEKYSG